MNVNVHFLTQLQSSGRDADFEPRRNFCHLCYVWEEEDEDGHSVKPHVALRDERQGAKFLKKFPLGKREVKHNKGMNANILVKNCVK